MKSSNKSNQMWKCIIVTEGERSFVYNLDEKEKLKQKFPKLNKQALLIKSITEKMDTRKVAPKKDYVIVQNFIFSYSGEEDLPKNKLNINENIQHFFSINECDPLFINFEKQRLEDQVLTFEMENVAIKNEFYDRIHDDDGFF